MKFAKVWILILATLNCAAEAQSISYGVWNGDYTMDQKYSETSSDISNPKKPHLNLISNLDGLNAKADVVYEPRMKSTNENSNRKCQTSTLTSLLTIIEIIMMVTHLSTKNKGAVLLIPLLGLMVPQTRALLTEFTKHYGGIDDDYANGIVGADNGDFVLAGVTYSKGAGNSDVWIVRVSQTGTLVWDKTAGYANDDGATCVDKGVGDSFFVGGYSHDGAMCPYVVKFSTTGTIEWSFKIGGDPIKIYTIKVLQEGSFVVAGENKYTTCFISKYSASQVALWTKNPHYDTTEDSYINAITENTDNTIVAAGNYQVYGQNSINWQWLTYMYGMYLHFDINGNTLHDITISNNFDDTKLNGISMLSDGCVMLGGNRNPFGTAGQVGYIAKLTVSGATFPWKLDVSSTSMSKINIEDIKSLTSTQAIIVAMGTQDVYTDNDIMLCSVKISDGSISWCSRHGGDYEDFAGGVYVVSPTSIAIGGYMTVDPTTLKNFFLTVVSDNKCPPTTYLSSKGSGFYCKFCRPGKYKDTTSDGACTDCSKGTYQDEMGQGSCKPCGSGTYQDQVGQTYCKTSCTTYINADRSACLYKYLFVDEATFHASDVKTKCFSGDTLIKPLTQDCRTAYRNFCCVGSTRLTTVTCNIILELTASDSLYNNYCNACPYMDQTQCPAQGVCWYDSLFTDNSYNPYSSFSPACLSTIAAYCQPKWAINANDAECSVFVSSCLSPSFTSSAYGANWDKFTITTNRKLPLTLPTTQFFLLAFNSEMTPIKTPITRISDYTISVSVSSLSSPPTQFMITPNVLLDSCNIAFPGAPTFSVIKPYDSVR